MMKKISWDMFNVKNSNKEDSFEIMCRHLFLRKFKLSGYDFKSNYNQTGLEIEPILYEEKYIGFQCKYCKKGTQFYTQLKDSLTKAFKVYRETLDTVYIYTNLDIKPELTEEEWKDDDLNTPRASIQKEAKRLGIELKWINIDNFTSILNEPHNLDIYRLFFSEQDEIGFLYSHVSPEERTFLNSNMFLNLTMDGLTLDQIEPELKNNKINLILGGAGTGKTEIMKKLFVSHSDKFIEQYNKDKEVNIDNLEFIPVFIKLRECIHGNLDEIIRFKLKDFNINNREQKFVYYLDGLDEISLNSIFTMISHIKKLSQKKETKFIVLSSRTTTQNIIFLKNELDTKTFKIDLLNSSRIDEYFECRGDKNKISKYSKIKEKIQDLLDEIDDIFSISLLWGNIEHMNEDTTKIELIELTAVKLIENSSKLMNANIPEPKLNSLNKILTKVAYFMQTKNILNISLSEFQILIKEVFSELSYNDIDYIINVTSEVFFDISINEKILSTYSFKHRRYHEYFLYKYLRECFYDDPFILRDLGLLVNRDFILKIFLLQELKESIKENNLLKSMLLRFFEAYLGEEYIGGYKNNYIGTPNLHGVNSMSYLESHNLLDYLCTRNLNELSLLFSNESINIKNFLNSSNYWDFVNSYLLFNGKDIRPFLLEYYNIDDEFKKNATEKFILSNLPIIYESEKELFLEIFKENILDAQLKNIEDDLKYLNKYSSNNIFEIFVLFSHFIKRLPNVINENISLFSKELIEILSYTLINSKNVFVVYSNESEYVKLRSNIKIEIGKINKSDLKINTVVLYYLLEKEVLNIDMLNDFFNSVNVNHFGTWSGSFDLNNYTTLAIDGLNSLVSSEYKLGVELREILQNNFSSSKNEILTNFILSIKKYNLVYSNWFRHNNSIFIGTIISYLDFNYVDLKKFFRELLKYESVISTSTVLYQVFLNNKSLFKQISNKVMLNKIYTNIMSNPSEYESHTDIGFMFSSMISCFDTIESDKLFISSINNSIFRPAYRKEEFISFILPKCIYVAYQNDWCEIEEIEELINRLYSMINILKDTTDKGGRHDAIKRLIEICLPNSPLLKELYDVESYDFDLETKGANTSNESIEVSLEVSLETIESYYNCEQKNIDYSNPKLWEKLISFEKNINKELPLLFSTLKKNYFPSSHWSSINKNFHIITAVLLNDEDLREKTRDFIIKQGGMTGIINLINVFSIIGEDELSRKYIHHLFLFTEALVYPNKKFYEKVAYKSNDKLEALKIIENSSKNEWNYNSFSKEWNYINNLDIKIKKIDYDDSSLFIEKWATKFPDNKAYRMYYEIIYKNITLKEQMLIAVDGYRAYLPLPIQGTNIIPHKDYKFALIMDELKTLNEYIRWADLIVE